MDLISNLPDELLLGIISLLSTKEAISTSVLSKKWEKVWVNLKRLHFHIESGSNLHVDQIDRILNRLQSFEISIYLDCSQKLSPGVVAKWIDDSVRLNPREIEIHVIYMEIPSTLFSCVNLTHLNLHSSLSSSITVPEDFCLPNVKSIVFMVSCPPKQLTEKIFRSCPELEKLKLGGIRNFIGQDYHKDLVYDISCPSLKFLDIRFWGRVTNATDPIIFLNAPNLESVEIADKFGLQFVVQGSCAPLKATIGLTSCCYDFEPEEDISRAYTLLKWMSGVKSLSMDECMTYALDIFPLNSVPPLLNLTRLYLNIPRLTDWTLFFNILENTPNLQSLTIEKECAHSDECSYPQYPPQDFDWTEPRSPATCLVSHLEEISIIGFYGMKCDLMTMKYLLANANVLNEFKASPRRLGFKKEDIFWMMLEGYAKNFTCRYVVLVPDE